MYFSKEKASYEKKIKQRKKEIWVMLVVPIPYSLKKEKIENHKPSNCPCSSRIKCFYLEPSQLGIRLIEFSQLIVDSSQLMTQQEHQNESLI